MTKALALALLSVIACSSAPTLELPPPGAVEALVERAEAAKEHGLSLSTWAIALEAAYIWPQNPPHCQELALAFSGLGLYESTESPPWIVEFIREDYIFLGYLISTSPPDRETHETLVDAVIRHEQLLDGIEELLTTWEDIRGKQGCGPDQ